MLAFEHFGGTPQEILYDCMKTAVLGEAAIDAYFSPSWTPFQADRGRHFSVIVDGVSD